MISDISIVRMHLHCVQAFLTFEEMNSKVQCPPEIQSCMEIAIFFKNSTLSVP